MQTLRLYIPFIIALVLLSVIVAGIYPQYQYYIDTDATSYLTISSRYAAGDYFRAINGYWSPWSCWLTAIFIKAGYAPFVSAIIVNTIAAIFFLAVCQSFFLLFGIVRKLQWVLIATMTLFLSYAVFKQSFDDLWECAFLLTGLRVMLSPHFKERKDLWIWLGITGGFAYYAKAYAFPFFILNTLCCSFIITRAWDKNNRTKWLQISGLAILTMCIIALPWIVALHEKYGVWMTSTAGTLNLSWYPVGHPFYKAGIQHLLPPVYPDSPSYWEDPWMVNGVRPYFWHSTQLFFRQVARVIYNMLLFVKCINEMSPFLLPVIAMSLITLSSSYIRNILGEKFLIVALSFLLFPLGFILINFEARYIWYMLFPGMLLGAVVLQKWLAVIHNKWVTTIALSVYAISFIAWPLWDMKHMYRQGKEEYEMAQHLQKRGIKGTFTANVVFDGSDDLEKISRLAYFSGNRYYNMPYLDIPYNELLADLKRHNVDYFFYYDKNCIGGDMIFRDASGNPFPEISNTGFKNLKIYKLN